MGAEKFKARSGRVVELSQDGSLTIDLKRGYLSPEVVMDVEEWAQARRDLELGRWRSPLHPDYVVYPLSEDRVRVLREGSGTYEDFSREEAEPSGWVPRAVAFAYFEARPERKPWEDAKPGEIWEIVRDGIGVGVYLRETHAWRAIWPFTGSISPASSLDRVTAARRFRPEVAS